MTARPAPPSAMVEAVRDRIDNLPAHAETWTDEQIGEVIAAVLDNLPRAEMRAAIIRLLNKGRGDYPAPPEDFVDAAISAARAAVLDSAKGDA